MKRRHLLYLAFWFPPSRASGVYRAVATARAFIDSGWDVTVVTTSEEFLANEIGSIDSSLMEILPKGLRIKRVPFSFDPDLREISRIRGNFPILWQKGQAARTRFDRLRTFSGSVGPKISETYSGWIASAVAAATGDAPEYDHILATGNPFSAFEAARLISSVTGAGYSIDFRDPWTIDVFSGKRSAVTLGDEAAEAQIVAGADACFHVNQEIASAYQVKYPEHAHKHHVVLNGYDSDSVKIAPTTYQGGPVRFGMLGTVNDRWPLNPILEAWKDLHPNLPPDSALVLGGHLGYFAKSAAPLEDRLPRDLGGFEFIGPILKSDLAGFYASLDVVVVPVPGSRMVTSGKVYEAMASGLPFVVVQIPEGDARKVAQGHPLAFSADPDPIAVSAAMVQAYEVRKAQTEEQIESARSYASAFERQATIAKMAQVLGDC